MQIKVFFEGKPAPGARVSKTSNVAKTHDLEPVKGEERQSDGWIQKLCSVWKYLSSEQLNSVMHEFLTLTKRS